MARTVLIELLLFFIPFALYGLFLLSTQRSGVLDRANWSLARVLALVAASFLTVIVGVFFLAEPGGSPPRSTYIPAHIEDGKFVPGQTK
ncbi:MAG: hypothetical protein K2Y71_02635 [Xanthobacteraceae bacterium]|nr:hypothetical protein [Xanthobacteraceae bacterium]